MILLSIIETYLLLGVLYAVYFLFHKINKIDSSALHTSGFLKFLLFGGCVFLWPLLLTKQNISHR